jgi:hypothetical protein
MLYRFLIIITFVLFVACKKDKLNGDLESYKGKFKWVGNMGRPCVFCGVAFYDNSNADFSADIEFDNLGKVVFYINDELYLKKNYRVKKQSPNGYGGKEIEIRVDVPKSKLDINDKLSLNIIGDTLYIDKYPLPGYPGKGSSMGNVFVRN